MDTSVRKTDGGDRKRIGELLMEAGAITEEQLKGALRLQKEKGLKIVDALISLGHIDPARFSAFLARQPGVASIDLMGYDVPGEIIQLIPRELAIRHEVCPIDRLGRLLTLGMRCPLDASAMHELEEVTKLRIKPILCSSDDIRAAIKKYYGGVPADDGETAQSPKARDNGEKNAKARLVALLHQVRSLPALPEVIHRVRGAMSQLTVNVDEMAAIVALDPAMAARILRMANLGAYGFPGQVGKLELAISLLGLRETYSLVLSSGVVDPYDRTRGFDYRAFWLDALFCATVAKSIARTCDWGNDSLAFLAGLLHDLGRFAMHTVLPDRLRSISPALPSEEQRGAELSVLGMSHAEVGHELARYWGFPPDLCEAIRWHHYPGRATADRLLVSAVSVGAELSHAAGDDMDGAQARCVDTLVLAGANPVRAKEAIRELSSPRSIRAFWKEKWEEMVASPRPSHHA